MAPTAAAATQLPTTATHPGSCRRTAAPVCRLWADLARCNTHKLTLHFSDRWWRTSNHDSRADAMASLFAAVAARRDTLRVLAAWNLESDTSAVFALVGCLAHSVPALESLELGGEPVDVMEQGREVPPQEVRFAVVGCHVSKDACRLNPKPSFVSRLQATAVAGRCPV